MKKQKIWIVGLMTILLVGLSWLLLRDPAAPQEGKTQNGRTASIGGQDSSESGKSDVAAADLARIPGLANDEQKRARVLELREIMDQANQPIQFWGKVVDQCNTPLSGVEVQLSIRHTRERVPGATEDVFEYLDIFTDGEGLFRVADRKGALVGVESLTKNGYEAPYVGNRVYWYAAAVKAMKFSPDENNPEVFRMWRRSGAERLIQKGISTRIPYDGRSVLFDLQYGTEVASGGDLRVTLLRTPLVIKRGQQKYDWTATIEAVEGGLIETTDEFMYLAPDTGYVFKLVLAVSAKDPHWSPDKEIFFYLRGRGGRTYSRVKAKFMTDSEKPKTLFVLDSFTNPSGSRNLEYDPSQDLVPTVRLQPTTTPGAP